MPHLATGTAVRPEGPVVHLWFCDDIQRYDRHVALFEGGLPDRSTDLGPVIRRDASTSLLVLTEDNRK